MPRITELIMLGPVLPEATGIIARVPRELCAKRPVVLAIGIIPRTVSAAAIIFPIWAPLIGDTLEA
ncbi:hypothetical protein PMJ10TS2_73890 [Paenibacillus melissococcoides]